MAMISKLGNDAIGDNYMENFADVCMNTANVGRTDDASTGAAAIIVDGDGNNAIAVVMGANNLLTLEDVEAARPTIAAAKLYVSLAHASLCAAALRVVSLAVIRVCTRLVCQLEIPREVTLAAMRIAREEGTMTFLNTAPAPADGLDEEFIQLAVRAIAAPAPRTATALLTARCIDQDIICPNEPETEMLTGMPVDTLDDAKAAAQSLLGRGAKNVILTLGERGAMLVNADEDGTTAPAEKVTAVVRFSPATLEW
eukprot:COSAG04_NODE_3207_length_3049_cov_35.068814_1_plen_255_part_00